MFDQFTINYYGHDSDARRLILSKNIGTVDELAIMNTREIESVINDRFSAIHVGDDWILIPKDKVSEFSEMVEWICR